MKMESIGDDCRLLSQKVSKANVATLDPHLRTCTLHEKASRGVVVGLYQPLGSGKRNVDASSTGPAVVCMARYATRAGA